MKSQAVTTALLVQHNALVNARFHMTGLESRLFHALLKRVGRDDDALVTFDIPVQELSSGSSSKSLYAEVNAMRKGLLGKYIEVEELGPNGERLDVPNLLGRPLMGVCDYLRREGMIRASFNVHMKPYLLNLKKSFTKADLEHLLKLKSPAAQRIYWLLREAAGQGRVQRTIQVDELRAMLGMENEYVGRFDNFRKRVLERACLELDQTDLPCTFTTKTKNRVVDEIVFSFGIAAQLTAAPEVAAAPAVPELVPAEAPDGWQALLLANGVTGLRDVQQGLDCAAYDVGYISFVVEVVAREKAAGRIKHKPGAIFKGITEGYYQAQYREKNAKPAKGASQPAASGPVVMRPNVAQRRRLQSQLEDALTSMAWLRDEAPEDKYPGLARAEAVAKVEAQIAQLRAVLD